MSHTLRTEIYIRKYNRAQALTHTPLDGDQDQFGRLSSAVGTPEAVGTPDFNKSMPKTKEIFKLQWLSNVYPIDNLPWLM